MALTVGFEDTKLRRFLILVLSLEEESSMGVAVIFFEISTISLKSSACQ